VHRVTPTSFVLSLCVCLLAGASYIVKKAEDEYCAFPNNVHDANDPACMVKVVNSTNSVEQPAQPNMLYDKINQARMLWGRWVGDVQRTWWVIAACGIVLALALGLVYLLVLRTCAHVMVFLTIVLVFALMIAFTFFCYVKAGIFDPSFAQDALEEAGSTGGAVAQRLVPSEDNKTKYKYAAYIMTALTIVLLLIVFAIRRSIVNAVHIIRQAARALSKHCSLVFYPLITVAALFALMVYFIFVGAAMMSAGDKIDLSDLSQTVADNAAKFEESFPGYTNTINVTAVENQAMKWVEPLTATRYLFAYHFFGLLWTAQVIQGIGMMTIAGVIAQYVRWRVVFHHHCCTLSMFMLGSLSSLPRSLSLSCVMFCSVALRSLLSYYFEQGTVSVANPVSAPVGDDGNDLAVADNQDTPKRKRGILCTSLCRALGKNFGSIVFGSLLIAIIQFVRIVFQYVWRCDRAGVKQVPCG